MADDHRLHRSEIDADASELMVALGTYQLETAAEVRLGTLEAAAEVMDIFLYNQIRRAALHADVAGMKVRRLAAPTLVKALDELPLQEPLSAHALRLAHQHIRTHRNIVGNTAR
ncbi:hypothetical protein AUC69_10795 [Methyloceanibacter superfactus]|uniref:Uncharacterized protein n=1 Tax=Methyloceanibacter superfactus TaxID=1774969 RepID=A0A1E3VXE4_9HYPH|nr:hypothetical protein AUC69_10795 [Methyloceanibacter superfactus]